MFCFPNTFGRRERLQGAADCTGVPTERSGRWRRRTSRKTMPPVLGTAVLRDVSPTERRLSRDDRDYKVTATPILPLSSDSEGHEGSGDASPTTLVVNGDSEGHAPTLPVNDSECCADNRRATTPTLPSSESEGCEYERTKAILSLPVEDSEGHENKRVEETPITPQKWAETTPIIPVCDSEGCGETRVASTPSDSERIEDRATTLPVASDSEGKRVTPPTLTLPVSECDTRAKAPPSPSLSTGARFKLLREGDIQVCYLNRARTVVSKILSSKFLRRWETHRLYLNDACISSKTPNGVFDVSVTYSSMEEVYVVTRWDAGHKFCIRVVIEDGSLLLQASSSYIRDQWFHSILWKKNIFKYRNILKPSSRPEVVLKELKNLVNYATTNPLQDECVIGVPIQIVSDLLAPETTPRWRPVSGDIINSMAPLLENTTPSPEMCRFFSDHCVHYPRSAVVRDTLTPFVQRVLIHNVDFGKYPNMRQFIQDYIKALYQHNDGAEVVRKFVTSIHGPGSVCPHLRVLPNLVSACLAAVFSVFEDDSSLTQDEDQHTVEMNTTLQCFLSVTIYISEYDDWRPELAQLLQPVPFPPKALCNKLFLVNVVPVMKHMIADPKCDIQDMVLGVREGKPSWLHVFCPSQNKVVVDDGTVWCLMVERLLTCCSRRKLFLSLLVTQLGACLLLALRGHSAAQDALCLMLEWELVEQEDQKMQIVTTLQSTLSGLERYADLCQRQLHLKELQQKGGPRKLTLPSRSTDEDIARLLSCGSFGNLACLSLAFTHVTSSCASVLIKLPALRYLNLWATQFGDPGLLMISEHLHKLQVLNLCETPVTDAGIAALSSMTNLRKLNLNSTKLTARTFECLKKQLPELVEFDVRYTEAW